ncbi:MAG: hypothetical protein CSA60_02845 [Neptuniibacter caesariensis]|uniref:Catalase n=1 Tax=Neptuniibacter caesariensis TaxID=207954 RepID=A0A2G6JNA0_NEPCE|nr:MAG: hypothetical protein CSA60_02845 [Neptuniibacter caesariensis]
MQIFDAANAQALNANAVPQELRSREAVDACASAKSVPSEQELHSSRGLVNRDRVTLSAEVAEASRLAGAGSAELEHKDCDSADGSKSSVTESPLSGADDAKTVEEEKTEQQELELTRELSRRDREVRAHEQAHAALGGQYASAPTYTYERGPDGRMYAVEGEVKIDTTPIPNDPQATLEKAELIQRAALGVAEPSSADRAVAAKAQVMATEARAEILQQEEAKTEGSQSRNKSSQEDEPTAGERLQKLRDEQAARAETATEALNDFNNRMNDINKQLAEINKKLVDAGVFQKLFPEGSLLDREI